MSSGIVQLFYLTVDGDDNGKAQSEGAQHNATDKGIIIYLPFSQN